MECDSIHSTIEHAKKHTTVFVPQQWSTVISMAQRKNLYLVVLLKFDKIRNIKAFTMEGCPNMGVPITGCKINWKYVRWVQVR